MPLTGIFGGLKLTEAPGGRHFLIDAVVYNPKTATCAACGYGCVYPRSLFFPGAASGYIVTPSQTGDPLLVSAHMCDGTTQPGWECECDFSSDDPTKGILPAFYTDGQGAFLIKNLTPGTYTVQASKEQDGYPETDSPFLSGPTTPPRVSVYDQQITRGVTVQLGPKVSRLVGRVVDATTHRSINNAKIIISRVDNPTIKAVTDLDQSEAKVSPNIRIPAAAKTSGTFNILVPSTEIKINVSAPGYEDWYYNEGSSKEKPDILYLPPSTMKELVIRLRPINK